MKKLYKTLSVLMATIVFVAMLCGISVNATETAIYKHFDVTDTNYTANTKLELNSIDNGLRHKPKLNELSAGACAYETAIALQ